MTINSWYSNVPVEIAKGGTNANAMATANGIIKYDGTRLVTSATALIDAGNRYTNSSQPAFLAYATPQVNVIGDGTGYNIIFANALVNQGASFDGVSTFTAPKTGTYLLGTTISLGYAFVVGNNEFDLSIATTSSGVFRLDTCNVYTCSSAFSYYKSANSTLVYMTAGQTARVNVFISGAAKTISILGDSTFWGYLVC